MIRGADGEEIKRFSRYIGVATNNAAEYSAAVYALQEALMLGARNVDVFSDSELLVKQVSGEYKVKNEDLKRLKKLFDHLCTGFSEVRVSHVGREKNKTADMLASQAVKDAG